MACFWLFSCEMYSCLGFLFSVQIFARFMKCTISWQVPDFCFFSSEKKEAKTPFDPSLQELVS
uniref:Uncharacterized protein n=1 Tax=Rhizophora mucronata TaxID=61149 RepID=A0A2P2JNA5_RHIMU